MQNTILAIVGILLSLLAGINIVRDILKSQHKRDEQEDTLEALDKQIYEQGNDHMLVRGRLAARQDNMAFLTTKQRLAEARQRALGYTKKYQCLVAGYEESLARSFSDGYLQEQEEMLQGLEVQQQTTKGQSVNPTMLTRSYPLANERETA